MEHLKARVVAFKATPEYKKFLGNSMSKLDDLRSYDTDFVLYMTKEDQAQYGEYVLTQLEATGISRDKFTPAVKEDSMIGGIILDSPLKNLRIDLSIATLMDDHRDEIVEMLFQAIGEVGGLDE